MEQLVQAILALSNTEDLKRLKQELEANQSMIEKHHNMLNGVLSAHLSPAVHSLAYCFLLYCQTAKGKHTEKNRDVFIRNVKSVIREGNPDQLRLVPKQFARICQALGELCAFVNKPLSAIKPLGLAIEIMRTKEKQITPIHAPALISCLKAKHYKAAEQFLEVDFYQLDRQHTGITSTQIMLFCYYSGIAYIGLKKFPKALESLLLALVVPSAVVSQIAIEAYKKYSLVHLLVHGRAGQIPNFASAGHKVMQHCEAYLQLAKLYESGDIEGLHKFASLQLQVFAADKNFGLVKQCISSLYKVNIKRHARTFITLSLAQVASSVKLDSAREAEKAVLRMIEDDQVFATINQKDCMLSFLDDPEQFDTTATLAKMHQKISRAINLCNHLRLLEERISCSPNFIQKELDLVPPGHRQPSPGSAISSHS